MKLTMLTSALLLLASTGTLSAQQAPRQLSEKDLARLRSGVERSKELSAEAASRAEARRQEEQSQRQQEALRRQEEQLAYEDDEYYEDDQPAVDTASAFLGTFIGTLNSEMAKKQQEEAQRQRFLDNVRREAEAVDRQRQRDQERQRLVQERARLERQAEQQRQLAAAQQQRQATASSTGVKAASGIAAGGTSGSTMTAQQQAARTREDTLRADVAAERKRLAEERERNAAMERQRVAGKPQAATIATGASTATPASVSSAPKPVAEARDHGPAKAWCRARRNEMAKQTEYQCMGPLQNLLSWYPTLGAPLGMAGCPGGEGYTPTPEHGGSSFNCGRKLKVGDLRMPTYDPYRGGGNPVRITAGN